MLKKLCLVLLVTGASHDKVCDAIEHDFQCSQVKAVTPQEFLEIIGQEQRQ